NRAPHYRMTGRSPLLVAACALLPHLGGAQADSASVRQVLATEDRRFAAMVHADTAALAHLLARDLTYTHTDGALNTRAELLQIVGSGALRYASIRSEEHTSELQSRGHLVCRLLLEKKKK